jgi:molybdopterin-guanine dinucleotide biosynthesis protein A
MSVAESRTSLVATAGFILAGGESRRMGCDKALLELRGSPLLFWTSQLLGSVLASPPVVIGPRDRYRGLGLSVVDDDWPGRGPLGGIATALRVSGAVWNLVVACDLPYLTKPWLDFAVVRAQASPADAVLPMNFNRAEPLCAMYHKRCESVIRAALESGTRKVTEGLAQLSVERIEPSQWQAFDADGFLLRNMNSPADYEEAKRRLG